MHTIIGQKMAPIHVAGRAKTLKQKNLLVFLRSVIEHPNVLPLMSHTHH